MLKHSKKIDKIMMDSDNNEAKRKWTFLMLEEKCPFLFDYSSVFTLYQIKNLDKKPERVEQSFLLQYGLKPNEVN